ncbi:hypothetical protein DRO91_01395 [Candidatus Heimdallarchaeota archaeon]|nr:MAG: hypothetical protein DRP02_06470 [Candidatus Gerdarchaeota archaeon]RLI74090.1 MAG: hypothetical protein DRO91_01395 [Candidatus Heimdallarchaeota archaeon]
MTFFTWQTDPLLYDEQPVQENAWTTANKLIERGQFEHIFYDRAALKLELYPILVRKTDFVRKRTSDRILARFPFKVLTEDEIAAINDRLLSLAEHVHHYFYRSIDFSIRSWRDKLRHYLERGALPFPLLRCFWALEPELPRYPKDYVAFESARGKRYKLPCKVTKQLAYLCGVVNGDGHLRTHWLHIVDESKEHIQFISRLFKQTFDDNGILFQVENAWNVELRSSSAVRLFHFLTDHKIAGVKYPFLREPLLFRFLGPSYQSLYWRGAMDADGSYTNQISFTSTNRKYCYDFQCFLQKAGISSKLHPTKLQAFMVLVPAKHTLAFAKLVGASHPKKQADFYQLLRRTRYSSQFAGLKPTTLTPDGYFNFLLLPGLLVVGLKQLLRDFRAGRSYSTMQKLFTLYPGGYLKYEKQAHAIPLSLVHTIVQSYYQQQKSLMAFLAEYTPPLYFKSATSKAITLPFKPNKELLKMLPALDPRETYINLLIDHRKLLQPFYNQFHVILNSSRLHNRLVTHFLMTFFDYGLIKSTVTNDDFAILQQEWREVLILPTSA